MFIYTCTHTYIYPHISINVVNIYMYIDICVYVYIYIYIIYVCIHTHIHMCVMWRIHLLPHLIHERNMTHPCVRDHTHRTASDEICKHMYISVHTYTHGRVITHTWNFCRYCANSCDSREVVVKLVHTCIQIYICIYTNVYTLCDDIDTWQSCIYIITDAGHFAMPRWDEVCIYENM